MAVSRKKYGACLKMLKAAVANEKLSWVQRMRAAEIICSIYNVDIGELSNKRDVKLIRELVEESAFDREIKDQLQQQSRQQAIEAARQFLADNQDVAEDSADAQKGSDEHSGN